MLYGPNMPANFTKEEAQNQVDDWGRNYDQETDIERERMNRKAS